MKEAVIFRADASSEIGTGHVMRCLALAQAWQEKGRKAIFVTGSAGSALEERLKWEGIRISQILSRPGSADDALQTSNIGVAAGAGWLVVDGYHFSVDYQQWVKQSGLNLLFIDDNGDAERYYADIVLNQNLHAHEGLYQKREFYTRLLLGTQYVLLRREFLNWRKWKRKIPQVARKVLVTLGGSDPHNVTLEVIRGLHQLKRLNLKTKVVVGPANIYLEALRQEIRDCSCQTELLTNVNNMPELMAWADLAISGGGSTCWELAFMGLPNSIVVLAENQSQVAEVLQKRGTAINLGWCRSNAASELREVVEDLIHDRERRSQMSFEGRLMVTGTGAQLVTEAILN
jgi:UDP-2,4-diacetamido-2,4,6-trideoxy-beta-L-altropyranose hydrolase